ncbi:HNH endonuclease signature motif containing protein [Luteolibacter soli]|uniref:HNH endonuclease signature motif containing protein n=1 Tax=Luteolibacter soli TaxID=3135280 RepID=A0ABU9APE4_9BACT
MPFSREVADEALVRCAQTCCLCRRYSGTAMQTHHIIQEASGGSNELENCIPLCLLCHEEVGSYNPAHPIGRKFTPEELRGHRDIWFQFVAAHPERIGNSSEALFRSLKSSQESTTEVRAIVEPYWRETMVWSKEGGSRMEEIFTAKVRNQGAQPIYVDSIGFTVGERKYPGRFAPRSTKSHDESREVLPGRFQIFSFFEVKMESEDVPLIDGMYLVTGAGRTFENRGIDLRRLIEQFQDEPSS